MVIVIVFGIKEIFSKLINDSYMLTALQETKLQLFFNILDYDRNGFIEKEDFQNISENICSMLNLKTSDEESQVILQSCVNIWHEVAAYIDTNRDDKASFYEWLRYADEKIINCDLESYGTYVNEVVEKIFDLFDEDNDNYISLKEYLNLFMTLRLEIRYSAKAFTKIDKNHDELISREELKTAVEDFFRSNDETAKGNWLFGAWEKLSL